MIHSLRGKVIQLKPWELILEAGFIGYSVKITLQTYESLKNSDAQEVFLYTRVIYREIEQTIYGFLHESEAMVFDFLRKLQGIGPHLASNVISHLGVKNIFSAIARKDHQMLIKVPKIGKHLAHKILFEAEGKKKQLATIQPFLHSEVENTFNLSPHFDEQLEETLSQLGFQKKEIDRATSMIHKNKIELPQEDSHSLPKWIQLYLRYL